MPVRKTRAIAMSSDNVDWSMPKDRWFDWKTSSSTKRPSTHSVNCFEYVRENLRASKRMLRVLSALLVGVTIWSGGPTGSPEHFRETLFHAYSCIETSSESSLPSISLLLVSAWFSLGVVAGSYPFHQSSRLNFNLVVSIWMARIRFHLSVICLCWRIWFVLEICFSEVASFSPSNKK